MNVRQVAAIARKTERERTERRLQPGVCRNCGHRTYAVGIYRICRNLGCKQLVV